MRADQERWAGRDNHKPHIDTAANFTGGEHQWGFFDPSRIRLLLDVLQTMLVLVSLRHHVCLFPVPRSRRVTALRLTCLPSFLRQSFLPNYKCSRRPRPPLLLFGGALEKGGNSWITFDHPRLGLNDARHRQDPFEPALRLGSENQRVSPSSGLLPVWGRSVHAGPLISGREMLPPH